MLRSVVLLAIGFSTIASVNAIRPMPKSRRDPTTFQSVGCYTDQSSKRSLKGPKTDGDDMTVTKCLEFCDSQGQSLAGLEFGRECFCDNLLRNKPTKAADTDCSKPCAGDATQICGDGSRLSIYSQNGAAPQFAPPPSVVPSLGPWKSQGCWSDTPSRRTLEFPAPINGQADIESCTTACKSFGYPYSGLEFGNQCWCGFSILYSAKKSTACDQPCDGDETQVCGGADAVSIYKDESFKGLATSFAIQSPLVIGIPYIWVLQGCFVDSASNRILPISVTSELKNGKNSAEACVALCRKKKYKFAGMEFGHECYCGNEVLNSPTRAPRECKLQCNGNSLEMCGDAARMTLYTKFFDLF